MTELIWCPRCEGPAKVVRDWRGDETIRCDAFVPCRDDSSLERVLARERMWRDGETLFADTETAP